MIVTSRAVRMSAHEECIQVALWRRGAKKAFQGWEEMIKIEFWELE
jgi:phosphoribosylformimino-5-aminoimidazole carboxamide ribonucleotide (ProFAR) isomerase